MTGTSLDGVDVAICDVSHDGDAFSVVLKSCWTAPYLPDVAYLVRRTLAGKASLEDLSDLQNAMAQTYASALKHGPQEFVDTVEAIGAHGQTIWHKPPESTWQILSGPTLSVLTGKIVVSDFRSADVALGGQGAPLVPMFDHEMLRSPDSDRVAVNIGGMANITLLPKQGQLQDLIAFDTGPGNVLINAFCEKSYGKKFDEGGSIASAGQVIPGALEELQRHPYFSQAPPKSTGREVFNERFVDDLATGYLHPGSPSEDLVATVTELTAWSIAAHIKEHQPSTNEVIVSGGGAHNAYLMDRLRSLLSDMSVTTTDQHGLPVDAKEAMCFAYLAYRTLVGKPGNVPSVTGARNSAILGSISNCVEQ